MRRTDWQAESQAVRNVADAIAATFAGHVDEASEAALFAALVPCGVTSAVFDRALWTLEVRRVVRRVDGRVFSERGTDDG